MPNLLASRLTKRVQRARFGPFVSSLRDLKSRVPAAWMWDSVYNEAQFTLLPYVAFAGGDEKRAAGELLDALKAMAAG